MPRGGVDKYAIPINRSRLQPHKARTRVGGDYNPPGPGQYNPPSGDGRKKAQRASSFGGRMAGEDRFKTGLIGRHLKAVGETPGPGGYETRSSLGIQMLSRSKSSQGSRFGGSSRNHASAQYYPGMMNAPSVEQVNAKRAGKAPGPGSHDPPDPSVARHRKPVASSFGGRLAQAGRMPLARPNTTPGPGAYGGDDSLLGKVANSRQRSTPGGRFGRSSRSARVVAPGMGPAGAGEGAGIERAVVVPSVGRQSSSRKRNAPAFSMGGRTQDAIVIDKTGAATYSSSKPSADPGPGQYLPITPIRRAVSVESRSRNHPEFSFGKGSRSGIVPEAARARAVPRSPGPQAYQKDMTSSIGRQALGNRPNTPSFGFGRATRDKVAKTSAPGAIAEPLHDAPGPIYAPAGSIGRQVISTKRNAGGHSFSKSSRADSDKAYKGFGEGKGDPNKDAMGKDAPPPGAYDLPEKGHAPSFSFGGKGVARGMKRPKSADANVGPGMYDTGAVDGVGSKTVDSRHGRGAAFGFGTSGRDKMHMAPGQPTHGESVAPGPGHYPTTSSLGSQAVSTKKNAAGSKFGHETRDKGQMALAPGQPFVSKGVPVGPGQYDAEPSTLVSSPTKRSAPGMYFGTSERSKVGANVG